MTSRSVLFASFSILALLTAHPLSAQEAIVLDAISVTATKTEDKVIDALAGSSVVTQSEIKRAQAARISDFVRHLPGVAVSENRNDPGTAIAIRGLQDFGRVNVTVDGARQNFQRSGHGANGMFYLDPEMVGGVDVTRGPVATVYGSGAIGGVAAFRTRGIEDLLRPDERFGVSQKLGWGTNGAGLTTTTSAGVRAGDTADFYGQFSYRDTGSYKDGAGFTILDTDQRVPSGLAKFNWRPADGHELKFSALAQNFDFVNGLGTAGSPRRKTDVSANTFTAGYTYKPENNDWVDFNAKTYYTTTDTKQFQLSPIGGFGRTRSFAIETTGFDIYNTSRVKTGPLAHKITYGGDYFRDVVATDDPFGVTDLFTPSGTRRVAGVFIEDEVRYQEWLRVLGALRYDDYKLEGGGNQASGSRLSPKITVGVTPLRGIEIYSTYAEGYRAPSVTETLINGLHPAPAPFTFLPNPNLKPETAKTLEAGVNIKYDNIFWADDAFRAKFNVFQNRVSDYIEQVSSVPLIGGTFSYQNISKAKLWGAEGEVAYDWQRGFAALSVTHTTGKNQLTGQDLVSVSPFRVSHTLGFRFLENKLTVGGRVTYAAGKNPIGAGIPLLKSKQHALVDLFASYEHNDRIRADLRLENLFDKRYVTYLDQSHSPGFTAKGALTVKFTTQ